MVKIDKRINEYIQSLPEWQSVVCRRLRQIIDSADPELEETIKRTNRPYFTLNGNVCALLGTKDHVTLFIYDPHVPDPHRLINQGTGNATARSIQFYKDDIIDESALRQLIKAVIAHNRAGGWRKLNKTHQG